MGRIAIEMPNIGYDMERATVSGWLKTIGDSVTRGDAVAEIETEKTTIEVEALASGTLVEIVHGAGAEVPVGETIGFLEDGSA
jgi:pyruvate/2-oxoglutarate dehydrogenase complex dihydrolipoamide acyltransferase (E2) component